MKSKLLKARRKRKLQAKVQKAKRRKRLKKVLTQKRKNSIKEYKKMTMTEIGRKLGVSGRTIYDWRKELEKRGIKLETEKTGKSDKDLFDSFVK